MAIIPYTFMPDPKSPSPLRNPRRDESENDASVVRAIRAAKDVGLSVMLKPQIWSRGSWPGDIEMSNEEDWTTFFDHYETWIRHYARIAEEEGVEIFVLGVELVQATRHESRWVEMAGRIRELYGGPLVYAANWFGEFDRVQFWDAFDYIGVDAYFPLSLAPDPTDAELRAGADEAVRLIGSVAERFSKRVLVTELGFASTEAPWIRPHASDRRDAANAEHQARAYQAMIDALEGQEWLAGAYWWKWPSHGRQPEAEDRSFSPLGKPAEQRVAEWYGGR